MGKARCLQTGKWNVDKKTTEEPVKDRGNGNVPFFCEYLLKTLSYYGKKYSAHKRATSANN